MAVSSTSNLDINSIVSQLMAVERQPITKLNAKEASYQAKLSAYGSVKGAVASFQSAVQSLSSSSKFQAVKATASDTTVFSASASSSAVAGTYSLEVTSLAQAQKLVAAGRTSSTAAIGTGTATTVTFDFGTIAGNTFNSSTGKYGTTLTGASTTADSSTVTVASTANLAVGAAISGTGIPAGATIASITDATHFVLSANATATGTADLQASATFTSNGSGTKSVTIDSTNNSLQGIRDAINAAKIGVTATIVNDGGASPYRLALSSDSIGASNSIKISTSVGGDAAVSALLAHDPAGTQNLSETVTAQNANFKVNGVAVSKTSNTVSDVVEGVTLTLSKVTASPATLTVARDTTSVSSAISGFVKAHNDLAKVLKDVSAYDAASQRGAVLQGDSTVRSLQAQLRSMLSTPVTGTSGALTTLSDVGVSFQKDGTLALNQTKLDSAIANNFSDIASLFAATGKATDSLVSYSSATSSTKAGNYAVNVTQLATRHSSLGSAAVPASGNVIASDTTISVALDEVAATSVALTAGTYTDAQLAAMLQSAINGTSAFSSAGSSVSATIDGGKLRITSNKYGSTTHGVTMADGSGTAVSALVGALATNVSGADVAGTIGGVAAAGSGQVLSASSGDPQGLSITINGGTTGARGTLNYSHGYAYLLEKWASSSIASDGILTSRTDGLGKTITDIGKQRTALESRLINVEKRYRAQFTALDVMLSGMNTTSTYLTQQINQLNKL